MADTFSTAFFLRLQEVGANNNTWGSLLNDDVITALDKIMRMQGGVDTTAGSLNAYTLVTPTFTGISALVTGQWLIVKANHTNTGASTFAFGATGAKSIKKMVAGVLTALAAGDIPSGHRCHMLWNTSDDCWILLNPAVSAVLAALAAAFRTGTSTTTFPTIDQYWAAHAAVELTDGSTISWDMATGINFFVGLTNATATIANPTNAIAGKHGKLILIAQGGARGVSFGANFHVDDDGALQPYDIGIDSGNQVVCDYFCLSSSSIFIQWGGLQQVN